MAIKYTKWPEKIPNGHKIYQMAIKYTTSFIARPSKIYPNFFILGLKIYHLAALGKTGHSRTTGRQFSEWSQKVVKLFLPFKH
jgi:hypothetical protein